MRFLLAVLFVASVVVACGSNPPPPPSTGATPPAGPGSGDGGATKPGDTASAKPSDGATDTASKPTMESQREPFMQTCMAKVKAPDYCQCGFEQFMVVFKDADLSAPPAAGDTRFTSLRQKTETACASKLPEDQIKAGFLKGCVGDDKRKSPYCECAWPALRKTLTVSDFTGDFVGPRFDDAKKSMVTACKGKFPPDIAKSDFVGECTKGDAGRAKPCDCLWKKVRTKYSVEEIVSGTADVRSVPGLDACN